MTEDRVPLLLSAPCPGGPLPCRCKFFAICWGLGISCTQRDVINLP